MRGLLLTTMNKDLGFLFEFCFGQSDTHFPSGLFVQIMNFFFSCPTFFSLPLSMFLQFTCLSPAALTFLLWFSSASRHPRVSS